MNNNTLVSAQTAEIISAPYKIFQVFNVHSRLKHERVIYELICAAYFKSPSFAILKGINPKISLIESA